MRAASNDEDGNYNDHTSHDKQRISGRKRALLRKYGKAIALSTTLLYGPMVFGSTAHAASTTAAAPNPTDAWKFKDFKDIKMKLSLAPGANVGEYEEILAKVEVEGEAAFDDEKYGKKEAALTIGDPGEGGGEAASSS